MEKMVKNYKKLLEALEFYADPLTYSAIAFLPDRPCGDLMEDFSDDYDHEFYDSYVPGKLARKVLKEIKEK